MWPSNLCWAPAPLWPLNFCWLALIPQHRDRFKLLKKRKGGDKLKKTVSAGGGVAAGESPLMQSCSLPPNVIHSVGGGGAGRSRDRDAAKGLTQSNLELGRNMDGISVWKFSVRVDSLSFRIYVYQLLTSDDSNLVIVHQWHSRTCDVTVDTQSQLNCLLCSQLHWFSSPAV